MADFSVHANAYLRNVYAYDRTLVKSDARKEASASKLSYADSHALKKAIHRLGKFSYTDADESKLKGNLNAFIDSYNYSLLSGSTSGNNKIAKNTEKMKELSKEFESDLKRLGISMDEKKGYLKLSDSATKNISSENYEKLFGKDSKYMKQLSTYAGRVNGQVNYYI